MVFAGDIMLDRGVKNSVIKYFGGDYAQLFKNTEILKTFDIVLPIWKAPFRTKEKMLEVFILFNMDPIVIPVLKMQA